ncbi:MAG: hypothetical protein IIU03_08390 [Bacteroidales bacterium]|nr:hypothetical protein [Bacteroidales bacterium]MEE3447358.1 hypothetical protein [Bacteroidales bacterium]
MSREALINLREYLLETLSFEDRMWLVSELETSEKEEVSECPYTKEELDKRFDEIEKDFENEEYLPADETFRLIAEELEFDKEIERIAV